MVANRLDGKAVSGLIRKDIKRIIEERESLGIRRPGLGVILVGEDPASQVYVGKKKQACKNVGIVSREIRLPDNITLDSLTSQIQQLNHDDDIDGILLQLPLPKHLDPAQLIDLIDPKKDVDGFHPYNMGRLTQRNPTLRACTPYGIMRLLAHYDLDLLGKHTVIVGASNIVGRPMSLECLLAGSTVTVTHRFTRDLESHVRDADVLIVAIGRPGTVKSEWINEGAIVVDVGITRLPDGKLTGDIEFETAEQRASWITPVPGGVGPMTVAMLLENTLFCAQIHNAQ